MLLLRQCENRSKRQVTSSLICDTSFSPCKHYILHVQSICRQDNTINKQMYI